MPDYQVTPYFAAMARALVSRALSRFAVRLFLPPLALRPFDA
jgi:hypothetical protein